MTTSYDGLACQYLFDCMRRHDATSVSELSNNYISELPKSVRDSSYSLALLLFFTLAWYRSRISLLNIFPEGVLGI
jgi:hypothetical protein